MVNLKSTHMCSSSHRVNLDSTHWPSRTVNFHITQRPSHMVNLDSTHMCSSSHRANSDSTYWPSHMVNLDSAKKVKRVPCPCLPYLKGRA